MSIFPNYSKPGPGVEPGAARKTGVPRFFELMGRDLWSFYRASLLCCLGFLPGFAVVTFGLMAKALLFVLLGGVLGGLLAGPFLCGLFDTLLRALRDEPGYWWDTYRKAWRRNWRESLVPGAVFGFFLAMWSYAFSVLPGMENVPTAVWVCMLVSVFLFTGFFTYVFAQLALFSQKPGQLLRNTSLLFMGLLPRTLAAAAIQCVYWGLVLLYVPLSLPVMLATGFWFPTLLGLMAVYAGIDKNFHLESSINALRETRLRGGDPDAAPDDGEGPAE